MKEVEKQKSDNERIFAWAGVIFVVLFFAILNGFLASRFSLWGDEFDAIAPALRPWRGERNFWWQIYQYIANPPGENLVLRLLYKTQSLAWLREASPEVFWRLPYIVVYSISGILSYFFAEKWSRSSVIATCVFVMFMAAPGPFTWATETRFYAWAILFMTCAVWQGILFIESGYSQRQYLVLAVIAAVGICFHISMALVCYLLFWFSLSILGKEVFRWIRERRKPNLKEILSVLPMVLIGLVPYFVFKHAKHHWMFVPGGVGFAAVLGPSLKQLLGFTPTQIGKLLPFSEFWMGGGLLAFLVSLTLKGLHSIYRRDWARVVVVGFLGTLAVGGPIVITLSSNANRFSIGGRHYLFVVPVILAGTAYLIFDLLRKSQWRVPRTFRTLAVFALFSVAIVQGVTRARANFITGNFAKVTIDLAGFRDFYRRLPDQRKLVLVGVGDQDLWAEDDRGWYIGGAHIKYLAEFNPYYLTKRRNPEWISAGKRFESEQYDFLFFVPFSGASRVNGISWDRLKCADFGKGEIRFCRIGQIDK